MMTNHFSLMKFCRSALAVGVILMLTGCKPELPPVPVPLTQDITGVPAPCQNLTHAGFPRKEPVHPSTFFVCRTGYALNFDPDRMTPEWVVHELLAIELSSPVQVQELDEARPDPLIAASLQSRRDDYIGVGYERMYPAPKDDFRHSDVEYSQADYLSNALHQHLGQKDVWGQLENKVRQWAGQRGQLFVITGPIYANGAGLGWVGTPNDPNAAGTSARKGKVQVPTHMFKVVIDAQRMQSIAFIVPNDDVRGRNVMEFAVTVADVEKISQIRFSPNMPLSEQGLLKTQLQPSMWP